MGSLLEAMYYFPEQESPRLCPNWCCNELGGLYVNTPQLKTQSRAVGNPRCHFTQSWSIARDSPIVPGSGRCSLLMPLPWGMCSHLGAGQQRFCCLLLLPTPAGERRVPAEPPAGAVRPELSGEEPAAEGTPQHGCPAPMAPRSSSWGTWGEAQQAQCKSHCSEWCSEASC